MRGRRSRFAAALAGVALCAPAAEGADRPPRPVPRAASDAVLIREADLPRARTVLARHGARRDRAVGATGFVRVRVRGGRAGALLRALDGVDAIPDRVRKAAAPDDPLLGRGHQYHVGPLRLEQAWSITHADGQVIAVLDTGVDAEHPDLAGGVLAGRDFVNGDADADDDEGHGTAVAGTAAAATGNGEGIAGVAWGAKVLPVKVLDEQGSGYDSDIAAGITWAADQGADVINLSLGGWGGSEALDAAVAYARGKGSVVVAAAGNEGLVDRTYPAASPGVIAVSATDAGGEFAYLSNYGDWIDVAAPGWRSWTTAIGPGIQRYGAATGTSFAAPVVSGVAALLRAKEPALGPDAVGDRLRASASDYGPRGIDPYYGHGFLDPVAALGGAARPVSNLHAGDGTGTSAGARLIPMGEQNYLKDGIAQHGEIDWFAFDAPYAGPYDMRTTLLGNPVDRPDGVDLAVELYGPSLQFLQRVDVFGTGSTEIETFRVPAPGRYYLRVDNFRGSRSPTAHFGYESYTIAMNTTSVPPLSPFMPSGPYDIAFSRWADGGGAEIVDVSGDGRPDVVQTTTYEDYTGSPYAWKLLVNRQTPENWLDSTELHDPPGAMWGSPMRLAAGDVTGDGRADVVVTTYSGIVLYAQKAAGGLGEPVLLGGTSGAEMVEVADWDRDGRNDLVWTRSNFGWDDDPDDGEGIYLQRNLPSGWQRVLMAADFSQTDLDVGDLDGDGDADLATLQTLQNSNLGVRVYRQQADGSIQGDALRGNWVAAAEIADVTGDGREDLLTGSTLVYDQSGLHVYAQASGGALAEPVQYGSGNVEAIAVGDFDGDRRLDVLTYLPNSWTVALHLQTSAGTLAQQQVAPLPDGVNRADGLAAGDITGDGVADAVQLNSNWGLVPLRRRTASWPPPHWVADATPADHARGVSTTARPAVRFARALEPASVTASSVALVDASTGTAVAAARSYDAVTRTVTVTPGSPLVAGRPYTLTVAGVRDTAGRRMAANGTRSRAELGGRFIVDGPIDEAFVVHFTAGAPPADTTPPDTIPVSGLRGTTRDSAGVFWAIGGEQGTSMECTLPNGTWIKCDPEYLSPLSGTEANGTYTVRMRARDPSGNVDPTPAEWTWTVDNTIARPPNYTDMYAKVITGDSGSDGGRTLMGGDSVDHWRRWHSPTNPGGRSLWYDWTAPQTARYAFDTAGSSYDTVLAVFGERLRQADLVAGDDDGGAGATSRVEFDAVAGRRYLIAAGGVLDGYADDFDDQGYAQAGTQVLNWAKVGAAPPPAPDTIVEQRPAERTRDRVAYITFRSETAGATFECRSEGGAWSACTSPVQLSDLADGVHAFGVRAVAGGMADRTPQEWTWEVDATPPETTISGAPAAWTASRDATFEFAAGEPASFECQLDGGIWAACRSPLRITGLAVGAHRFEVRATDAFYGRELDPARYEWTVSDESAPVTPETTIDAGPSGLVASRSATLAFSSATPGVGFECSLDEAAWTPCTSPRQLTGLQDGAHTFAVRAVGTVPDPTPATRTWQVDGTPPVTTFTATPPASTSATSATFEFKASEAQATFRCSLDGGDAMPCTSPRAISGLAPGTHTFDVIATDAAGNVELSAKRHVWTVESPAPDTRIDSGPTGLVASRSATFSFSSPAAGATFECRVDGGSWAACASPAQLAELSDGTHAFEVRALAAGATDPTPASRSWQVDATAPDTTITAGPPATTTATSATFEFTASEAQAAFQCRLDGGAWGACTSPRTLAGVTPGAHTFEVRAVDAAGNLDAAPAARSWTVEEPPPPPPGDTDPPETTVVAGPPPLTSARTATVELATDEPGSLFECSLDGGAWAPCTSPVVVGDLGDGTHELAARARDGAGNVDATPAVHAWKVDATPPQTTVGSGPAASTTETSARFAFEASETASFECRLDAGAWAPCGSPHQVTGLAAGPHAFEVRATDAAGNPDPTPARHEWTVTAPPPPPGDTEPPATTITAGPTATTSSRRAVFELLADEAGAAFECSLDRATWVACASPVAFDELADGRHELRVRARDAAGNVDPTPAVWTWTIEPGPAPEPVPAPDGGGGPLPPPSPGSLPAPPPARFADWLRAALESRPAYVGRRRATLVRVLSCPDRADSRFAALALCRLPARATLIVRAANGKMLRRARLTLAPGRARAVRVRVPHGARPVARLRLLAADGQAVTVSWRPRLRRG